MGPAVYAFQRTVWSLYYRFRIHSAGLSVPEDIGILGMNDIEIAGWAGIELTTIHQPISQIISSSVELIVATLADPDRYPESRLFPCYLVERKTLPRFRGRFIAAPS